MVRGFARSTSLGGFGGPWCADLGWTGAGGSRKTAALAVTSAAGTAPNATSEVDCNGLSPKYPAVKKTMQVLCTDPVTFYDGKASRFTDNGRYIGHDEPSTKFISSAPGTGNHFTYYVQLPVDPTATPTLDGSVSDYAELSPAPWFGLPICDPNSYPQNPCTPDSDSNTGARRSDRRRVGVPGAPAVSARIPAVARRAELRRDALLRRDEHRQPGVQLRLRVLQPELRGAGQLRVDPAERRPGRAAEPSGDGHVRPRLRTARR